VVRKERGKLVSIASLTATACMYEPFLAVLVWFVCFCIRRELYVTIALWHSMVCAVATIVLHWVYGITVRPGLDAEAQQQRERAKEAAKGKRDEAEDYIWHNQFHSSLCFGDTSAVQADRKTFLTEKDCIALCEFPIEQSTGVHIMEAQLDQIKTNNFGNAIGLIMPTCERKKDSLCLGHTNVPGSIGCGTISEDSAVRMNDKVKLRIRFQQGDRIRLTVDSSNMDLTVHVNDKLQGNVKGIVQPGMHFAVGRYAGLSKYTLVDPHALV